jgi:hypothetical protein
VYAGPIFQDDKNARILIIIDWLRDMETLRDQLTEAEWVKNLGLSVGTYSNLVKNTKEREIHLKRNIIIGSIGSMQNGKDISNLRAIFPFTQFSSEIVTHQILGRLRPIKGKEVIYYDIVDRSVPEIMKQRATRKKVFIPRSIGEIQEYIIHDMNHIDEPFIQEKPAYFRSVSISS